MCGICGVWHLDQTRKVDTVALEAMAAAMRHRGPDDAGTWIDGNIGLGHRRLSIIDLSSEAHQPMSNEDSRFWIVYNGEIYNYMELRKCLVDHGHAFRSHSDTEVIIHLYEDEGVECVSKLNGMFAFVIFDKKRKTLFAARDRLGIKPFYYCYEPGTFAFASEIKALFHSADISTVLNHEGLLDYLTFQFCLGDKTLFRNVKKLLPGHRMLLDSSGALRIEKYWDLDFGIDAHHTEEYFESRLDELLKDSIRLQLRADVEVGAHLSGGLDSSTVACLATAAKGSPIHTFCGGFREGSEYDETEYAKIVSESIRSNHHTIYLSETDFIEAMLKMSYQMDEPVAGPGLFPQYFVSKMAAEHVKVVLGGQGGDEVFGGYARYLIAYLEECLRGGIEGTQEDQKHVVTFESILPNLPQLKEYVPLLRYFWKDGLFEPAERRYYRLIDRSQEICHLFRPYLSANSEGYSPYEAYLDVFNTGDTKSYINRMTHFDLKTLLPALLHVEDRTSMMVSLESRVPLLDHRIVELVASMPPMIKYKGGRSKQIFRKITNKIVPSEICNRKDKMGFPVPLDQWYKKGPVREFVRAILLDGNTAMEQIVDKNKIEALLGREEKYGRGIWGLLSLELWFRGFKVSV